MLRPVRNALDQLPTNMVRAGLLLLVLPVVGTSGYMILEGWSFLDAIYMTVIVLTTIGFAETRPLDDSGRIFTMVLAVTGVGGILYAMISVFQFLIEGEFGSILGKQRMKGQIDRLRDHFILCGFGRVGEEVAREFGSRGTSFVVVENTPEAVARAERRGYLLLVGDATRDDMLRDAGVAHARCLLAASDSDAGNTFITLTAKAMNADLFVVARAANPDSIPRMQRAGADRVFSPYTIAGRQMAVSALQPMVAEFIDTLASGEQQGPILAEIEISEDSGLVGHSIEDVLHGSMTIHVLGVQRRSGEVAVGPETSTLLNLGDRIIVMGEEAELEAVQGGNAAVRRGEGVPSHRPQRHTPS